jgi:ribA/ribD-fused uncharacterized protein
MERVTDKYVFFWGSEFSNWDDCRFKYKNLNFYSTEQAFMYEKALHFGDIETAEEIIKTPHPKTCKELGRMVKNFNAEEWSKVSYDIMVDVNYAKYKQNIRHRALLIATEDKIIVEASPFDTIWGIGLHWRDDKVLDEANWLGQNLLGKALMRVRDELTKNKL